MSLVGIDFSLNSPGVCIYDPNHETYGFISFFNYPKEVFKKPVRKAFEAHDELMGINAIRGIMYNRDVKSKDYSIRESEKLADAEKVANMVVDTLEEYDITDYALEGFSYGSKGNSFIDMIVYNSFLRRRLNHTYGIHAFNIFQPSAIKKLAGKGNCDKLYMFNAFKDNVLQDPCLESNSFWRWVQNKNYESKKDIQKPLDDLIDSYFLVRSLRNQKSI